MAARSPISTFRPTRDLHNLPRNASPLALRSNMRPSQRRLRTRHSPPVMRSAEIAQQSPAQQSPAKQDQPDGYHPPKFQWQQAWYPVIPVGKSAAKRCLSRWLALDEVTCADLRMC